MSIFSAVNQNAQHLAKKILSAEYRELNRIKSLPRYKMGATTILGPSIHYSDALSFHNMYYDIFKSEIFRFKADNSAPVIIDGGANIGMATAYFKRLYPGSDITAIEADPTIYKTLVGNLSHLGHTDVETINKALWKEKGTLNFSSDGADGGHLAQGGGVQVETFLLSSILNRPVDLLKLDIEGAELEVLIEAETSLKQVKSAFIEYHSFENQPQRLNELLALLSGAGFRYFVQSLYLMRAPFLEHKIESGMDLQLNIFAYRAEV